MAKSKIVFAIALIEILIGTITFCTTIASIMLSSNAKTPNVLMFVLLTASASAVLGAGLLRLHKRSYELLIYFSSVIILSKVLIFAEIISLNGALETVVPSDMKSLISVIYHAGVIFCLTRKNIRTLFIA